MTYDGMVFIPYKRRHYFNISKCGNETRFYIAITKQPVIPVIPVISIISFNKYKGIITVNKKITYDKTV